MTMKQFVFGCATYSTTFNQMCNQYLKKEKKVDIFFDKYLVLFNDDLRSLRADMFSHINDDTYMQHSMLVFSNKHSLDGFYFYPYLVSLVEAFKVLHNFIYDLNNNFDNRDKACSKVLELINVQKRFRR